MKNPTNATVPMILPLGEAENQFLQVLIHKFKLSKNGSGSGLHLSLGFGLDTPAIRQRKAKHHITASAWSKDQATTLQAQFDALLHEGSKKPLLHCDPNIPFRYANGGALPVFSIAGKLCYCFHWRDIHPVGWNIANGGSDNRHELLNPELIIDRELREELIIIDRDKSRACRYVFETDEGGNSIDRDADAAWQAWRKRFIDLRYPHALLHETSRLPLVWLDGPDSVSIHFDNGGPHETKTTVDNIFLNITARDLGIEVDRVVHMRIPPSAVLCDGELLNGALLDSPIGLFEVSRVKDAIKKPVFRLEPDYLFHGARSFDPSRLQSVVEDFLSDKRKQNQRTSRDQQDYAEAKKARRCFDLCPVTRSIVRRHIKDTNPDGVTWANDEEPKVFISFASEDLKFAEALHRALRCRLPRLPVFFSPRTMLDSDYGRNIDKALASAKCLIAVGSRVENLLKGWPDYEWRSFSQELFAGSKPDGQLVSVISGFDPGKLPRQLRFREAITCHDTQHVEDALPHLMRFLAQLI